MLIERWNQRARELDMGPYRAAHWAVAASLPPR